MTQDTITSKEIKKSISLSESERKARRQLVLNQGRPSITRSIADAVVIKSENVFFLTRPDGSVPLGDSHGYGLYYHDCRFLNGYELALANAKMNVLVSATPSGERAIFALTNPELKVREGEHIDSSEICLTWERTLDGKKNLLNEKIHIKNYGPKTVEFPLSLQFQAGFEDIFAVRGLFSEQRGKLHPPRWQFEDLVFIYQGADGRFRVLSVRFSIPPSRRDHAKVHFDLTLEPREAREIMLSLSISEVSDRYELNLGSENPAAFSRTNSSTSGGPFDQVGDQTRFQSDSLLLNGVLEKSLSDLRTLVTRIDEYEFFAAGVPWFVTLFGRDSLITGLQTLAVQPEIAAETLRLLAELQAQKKDDWRDAQPGKILHELRVGELAQLGDIPQTPYYGTVDATPLFLILLAQHAEWTGDLSLFMELRNNVIRALEWIDRYGDANGDGYVEYKGTSHNGLVNQGWKDSGNAIIDTNGNLATPPISLVEVQGYVYQAKTGLARLFERAGEPDRAMQLRQEAERLRSNFNRDFWIEDQGIYALALEASGKPLKVVSSNPGHALWSGIADPDKARRTAERLMTDDMFSGWGIRTLSEKERGYNPTGYHLGTVWPHDNALIATGFRRYGLDEFARRIFVGILEAAMSFRGNQLPELFAGFSRNAYSIPVHYPVACHPQAWAAGSIPYLISTFLGLEPAAFEGQLRIRQPILPDFVDRIWVRQLRVGRAKVDLHYERKADGSTKVEVLQVEGNLDIVNL